MNFLFNLDYLLYTNNMNRSELARKIGIAPSTINAWFSKGYNGITLKNLLKISKCFDVSIEDLLNGSGNALHFTTANYSIDELKAIKHFSDYIKASRA